MYFTCPHCHEKTISFRDKINATYYKSSTCTHCLKPYSATLLQAVVQFFALLITVLLGLQFDGLLNFILKVLVTFIILELICLFSPIKAVKQNKTS